MNELEIAAEIEKAQREITNRLNELERTIGRGLHSAELVSIDVTNVSDAKPKYIRSFIIEPDPLPGGIGDP